MVQWWDQGVDRKQSYAVVTLNIYNKQITILLIVFSLYKYFIILPTILFLVLFLLLHT